MEAKESREESGESTNTDMAPSAAKLMTHSSVPVSSSVKQVESLLVQTLTDFQVRSEVEECMSNLLLDVETTFQLQQQLQLYTYEQQMHQLVREQKATRLERQAECKEREEDRLKLADSLVQELFSLNKELQGLMEWKQQHQHKVESYDDLKQQLDASQQALELAKQNPIPESVSAVKQETSGSSSGVASIPPAAATEEGEPSTTDEAQPDDKVEEVETRDALEASLPITEPDITEPDTPTLANANEEQTSETKEEEESAGAVVSLEMDDPKDQIPGLTELDMEILMTIFGFLDAMDILNTAQINLVMYSKVDNIFGITEDGQSPPGQSSPAPAPAPMNPRSSPVAPPNPPQAASLDVQRTAKNSATTGDSGLGKGLFNMLQPRPVGSGSKSPAPSSTVASRPPMNAAVAPTMASTLSDAELAAIISMTKKLSKMEKEVGILRKEKEALGTRLKSTEAVKQFLIGKVRDVELKLSQTREDEIKVAQQIASDQEVIAFLDSRVQELERSEGSLSKTYKSTQSELQNLKVSSSKKVTMLSDMLKYEREKLKEEEADWKATKKVLVKEVKNCRAQIIALQAERDGFKEQNEMLKRAITSTGKSTTPQSPTREKR